MIFALSLVTNAAAGALGVALLKIAANAIIWGRRESGERRGGIVQQRHIVRDIVEFCQKYMQSLRENKDEAVEGVR